MMPTVSASVNHSGASRLRFERDGLVGSDGLKLPPVRACCCCAPPMTTTTSEFCASSTAACCRCLVGWQTVSVKRTFARGNWRRINCTSSRTRSMGCVVWAMTPEAGSGAQF